MKNLSVRNEDKDIPCKSDIDLKLNNVPNVTTNNQTPTYSTVTSLAKLVSGEKLGTALGKIAKAVDELIAHLSDNVRHITAAERTAWNGKAAGNHTHTAATQSAAGFMSAADKTKLDGLSTYAKGIRGYTFLSDLKAGKYLKVLRVQLGDYRYYKYFTALLALNSFFASEGGSDKTKLDMIVSLDARQSSMNLDNIEFYAYSNIVPAAFDTERFIVAYKRVNTTDVLFEVYIRLVYDYEYFSANLINSYTLPASPMGFPMTLVDEIPSDMTTSTLYVNKTDINAPSATAEKAGLMSAADKKKLDGGYVVKSDSTGLYVEN